MKKFVLSTRWLTRRFRRSRGTRWLGAGASGVHIFLRRRASGVGTGGAAAAEVPATPAQPTFTREMA